MDLSDKILISSCYGIRELTSTEKDYKDFITNGQNLMYLTVVWGEKEWEDSFFHNLKLCEKYNISVLVHDNKMNDLGDNLTEEDVREYTKSYSSSPVYAGNGFADEPGPDQYPTLAHIIKTYLSVFPDKRTFINLLPMYAANFVFGDLDYEEYLEDFAKMVPVDHISVDVYPYTIDENGNKYTYDEYIRGLDMQAQVCRKYNKEFWLYVQSMEFLPNREPGLEEMRFQVWSGLCFGMTHLLHFCYDVPGGSIRADRTKKSVWTYTRTVNMELSAISDAYMQYKNLGAYTYEAGDVPEYTQFENNYEGFDALNIISSNETLLVGCFDKKEGNGKAFTVVNMSEVSLGKIADVEFAVPNAEKVTAYIKGIPTVLREVDGKYYVSLDCGEGAFVTVEY